MERKYFDEIMGRAMQAASATNGNADRNDVNRNHVNYGITTTWAQVMQDMGHNVKVPVWEDENGCLRIPFLEIDGKRVIEYQNGK